MFNKEIILTIVILFFANIIVWFQLNGQLKWDWWKDKPVFTAILYSVPTGICFWYGIRLCYEEWGEVWGPRFLIFSMSYLTFPPADMVVFKRKHVYSQNHALCIAIVYDSRSTIILEVI